MCIQTFRSEATIEGLNEFVVDWLAWPCSPDSSSTSDDIHATEDMRGFGTSEKRESVLTIVNTRSIYPQES